MKKDKDAYIVELRKIRGKVGPMGIIPNRTNAIVGVFTSKKKAVAWIQTEGTDNWTKSKKKFWAILSSKPNSGESYLDSFYRIDGSVIEKWGDL